MTEQEWLNCTNPNPMIAFLRGKVSERKLRLFAVACCRLVWHEMTDERSRNAVEVAQRFADGKATRKELADARDAAPPSYRTYLRDGFPNNDECAATAAAESAAESIDAEELVWAAFFGEDMTVDGDGDMVAAFICRDIFGNPFRPVAVNPAWLAWNDATVNRIAEGIYDERAFDRLPILADALEDAGCDNADILAHLRMPARMCVVAGRLT